MAERAAIAAGFAELRRMVPIIQQAVHDELHTDTYACYATNRGAAWEDGTDVETTALVETGTGKLYAHGAGGPQAGDTVIHVESPYRFRTTADSAIDTGHLLVVNGARLFRVDVPKREADADLLMDVYVTELVATPMPEGA